MTHYPKYPPANLYDTKIFFYDKNWKGVKDGSTASYYRYAYYSKTSQYISYCIDYYITGELQGEGGFIKIDQKNDSKSIFNGEMYWYDKSGELIRKAEFKNGKLIDSKQSNETTRINTNNSYNPNSSNNKSTQQYSDAISLSYFEKKGASYEEEFSLLNNSGKDISFIQIRLIYKLENGNVIDYQDFTLHEKIQNGLSKKFTVKSFDQKMSFVYKYGEGYKGIYTLFTVSCQILNYY